MRMLMSEKRGYEEKMAIYKSAEGGAGREMRAPREEVSRSTAVQGRRERREKI